MKQFDWELPHFSLSLERLWTHSEGPKFSKAHSDLMTLAQQKLNEKFRSGKVGFYDWVESKDSVDFSAMQTLAKKLRHDFEGALCFGIGGSYLGPNAALEALRSPEEKSHFPIGWVNNVDPGVMEDALYLIQKKRCAAIVISKSGTTIETLSAFYHLSHQLDPKGFVMITDPKVGELRRLASANGWNSFEVPPALGGRFSVLSAVGLFPMLLGGLDAEAFFEGASEMRMALQALPAEENPAYHFGLVSFLWDTQHHHPIHYLMPYGNPIQWLSQWFVQLWAESLGKKTKDVKSISVGPTPVAAVGTCDQHSILQLLKEGPSDKIVGFIEVGPSAQELCIKAPAFSTDPAFHFLFGHSFAEVTRKASRATETSLNNAKIPTYRIKLHHLSEKTLGAFFFFLETACAAAGEFYGVDAFDQPGVEEAKKLLRQSLSAS